MTPELAALPAPFGIWDARTEECWYALKTQQRIAWAKAHIPDADTTYRIEFFLVDAPFAVVYRYAAKDPWTLQYQLSVLRDATTDEPVVVPLAELPPPEILAA